MVDLQYILEMVNKMVSRRGFLTFLREKDNTKVGLEYVDITAANVNDFTKTNGYHGPNGTGKTVEESYGTLQANTSAQESMLVPINIVQPTVYNGDVRPTIGRQEFLQTMGMLAATAYMMYKECVKPSSKSNRPTTGFSNGVYHVVFPNYSSEQIARKKVNAQRTILIAQDPLEKMTEISKSHRKEIEDAAKDHGVDPRYLEAFAFLSETNPFENSELENIAEKLGQTRSLFGRNTSFSVLAYKAGNEQVTELIDTYLTGHKSPKKARSYLTYEKVRFKSSPCSTNTSAYNMMHDKKVFEEGSIDYPWKVIAAKELFDQLHDNPESVERDIKNYKDPPKPSGALVDFAKRHHSDWIGSFMKNWVINLDPPQPEYEDSLALPTDENKFSYRTEGNIELSVRDIGMIMAVSSLTRFESSNSPINVNVIDGKIVLESHNCPDQSLGLQYVLDRFADMNYVKYTKKGDSFTVSRTGDDDATAYFKRIYRLSRLGL